MSQVPIIFAGDNPDIILGKVPENVPFPIPDEISSAPQIRKFEVWNTDTASFYNWSGGKILEITNSGINVVGDVDIEGDETISGSIQVGQDVTVQQTVTADIVCANFLCDIPFTTFASFVNNPYLAGIVDGSITPGDGGGGGGTGFTGSHGFTGSQGVTGFTGSAGSGGSGASVTISSTQPLSPAAGDLWWNDVEGQLKIYYADSDSQQWVDASAGAIGATGFTGSGFNTSSDVQINSLGVGTSATGVVGEIIATGEITAYFSDARLKTMHGVIPNALEKINTLNGYYYTPNEIAKKYGYQEKMNVGVSAQEVQSVLPEIVVSAPVDAQYLTVQYEKLIPLLIEGIKELTKEIEKLKQH